MRRLTAVNASQESLALTIGDQQQIVPMTFSDRKAEERFRAALNSNARKALSVRITPAPESDVQGHAFDASLKSVWLKVELDGDDTEGHAISVRFPTAQDADNFPPNPKAGLPKGHPRGAPPGGPPPRRPLPDCPGCGQFPPQPACRRRPRWRDDRWLGWRHGHRQQPRGAGRERPRREI